jgi:hypothetical protein
MTVIPWPQSSTQLEPSRYLLVMQERQIFELEQVTHGDIHEVH